MKLPAQVHEVAFGVPVAPDAETATYAQVSARVEGSTGAVEVPCFWDGRGAWRARFRAPAAGSYVASPVGLPGVASVTVEVADPGAGGAPIVRRQGRRLVTSDGAPFLWLADTWWFALCDRAPGGEAFDDLLARRRDQGYTVVQVVAGLYPEVDAFDPLGDLNGRWPWRKGFDAIDPAWWDDADQRMTAVVAAGLVPAVVGAWSYYLLDLGRRRIEAHWREVVARWGAFPVVWCVAGEAGLPHYAEVGTDGVDVTVAELAGTWRELAGTVAALDGYRNLRTVHPCPAFGHYSSTDVFGGRVDDLDLIWLQTGHADRAAVDVTMSTVEREVAAPHGRPVVNSEVCYEGIAAGSSATLQRFLFWSHLLSGAAGHSYGAQGLWAFRRAADPGPGLMWGDATWQEASELPGAAQLGGAARLLRTLPWQLLEPAPWSLSPHATPDDRLFPYAAAAPGLRVAYFPAASLLPLGIGISQDLNDVWLEGLDEGPWRVTFWNPRSCLAVETVDAVPDAAGRWLVRGPGHPMSLPSLEDWVLLAERVGPA